MRHIRVKRLEGHHCLRFQKERYMLSHFSHIHTSNPRFSTIRCFLRPRIITPPSNSYPEGHLQPLRARSTVSLSSPRPSHGATGGANQPGRYCSSRKQWDGLLLRFFTAYGRCRNYYGVSYCGVSNATTRRSHRNGGNDDAASTVLCSAHPRCLLSCSVRTTREAPLESGLHNSLQACHINNCNRLLLVHCHFIGVFPLGVRSMHLFTLTLSWECSLHVGSHMSCPDVEKVL